MALLDEKATVPFIARYRKEATGGLDDTQLRTLEERLTYLREMEERRAAILKSIEEQGKLTPELTASINDADTKARLEDLYLPYKPKRRTKAQIAREAGLEPLALALLGDRTLVPEEAAAAYVNAEKGVADAAAALEGARWILMENFAEDAELVGGLREYLWHHGEWSSTVIDGKQEEGIKFSDYFSASEAVKSIPSHRILALLRGRNEGFLRVNVMLPESDGPDANPNVPSEPERRIAGKVGIELPSVAAAAAGAGGGAAAKGRQPADGWLAETVRWTWRIKMMASLSLEVERRLRDQAEEEAIRVFGRNLHDLLLAAPAGQRVTMGLDPGIRTGVKVAVVDGTGKLVDTAVIYPHEPRNDWDGSLRTLGALCKKHGVQLISIGNGTASRETDKLAGDLIAKNAELRLTKVTVSEAGASVYSASAVAAAEFPDLDVSLRGAVSIARRLQDPLAELVRIEPKAIGVGQYQHDVSQIQLAKKLDAVVEDCVNAVGADVNTASVPLLARISGLSEGLAKNIVAYRDEHGPFKSRSKLLKVPRVGDRTYQQAAGFLRIMNGDDPLDASAVHPGSVSGGAEDRREDRTGREGADRQDRGAARAEAGRLRGRAVRRADGEGHPVGAGEAGARSASGVQDRGVQGRRQRDRRPSARHDARRRRHQRRQLRRLRRHRRPPGRPGPRLAARRSFRQGSARRREGGRHRQREGGRHRSQAEAHRVDDEEARHAGPERASRQRGSARRRLARSGTPRRRPLAHAAQALPAAATSRPERWRQPSRS